MNGSAIAAHEDATRRYGDYEQINGAVANRLMDANERLRIETERLRDELAEYENSYICDCCEALHPDCVDAGGHMQCPSCCTAAKLSAEVQNLQILLYDQCLVSDQRQKRIEELERFIEAEGACRKVPGHS